MKNTLKTAVVSALVALFAATNLVAQKAETFIDSVKMGQAFSSFSDIESYSLHGEYEIDNDGEEISFEAKMDLQGKIFYFEINEVVIVEEGDTPLPGLPRPKVGEVTDFYVHVHAMSLDGDNVAFGGFSVDRLGENSPILVTLWPNDIKQFIEYEIPAGLESDDLRLVSENGNLYGRYDSSRGGFELWINPNSSSTLVYITNQDGAKLDSFYVEPFVDTRDSGTLHVSPVLAGGVTRLVFQGNNSYSSMKFDFDGLTIVDDQKVPSKVFIYDTKGERFGATFYTNNQHVNVMVHVYSINSTGKKKLIQSNNMTNYTSEYGWKYSSTGIDVPSGYGKIMIVTVNTGDPIGDNININFTKGYSYGGKG